MENNITPKHVVDAVKDMKGSIKEFEHRIQKNEQLLLHTFSYLYARHDSLHYDQNMSYISNELRRISDQCSYIMDCLYSNDQSPHIEQKKTKSPHKVPRPWHYFISAYFKKRRILKEREELHERYHIEAEQRKLKIIEEQRKRQEEARLEKIRREEEAKKKAEERRKEAKRKMAHILTNIKQE